MTGETTLFHIREYAGSWMSLGWVGDRRREGRDKAKGLQTPPSNLFVLHFDGMLDAEGLLDLAERLREAALAALQETGPSRQAAEAERAGQLKMEV